MLYDITCLGTTVNLDKFFDRDSTLNRFLLETALRFSQCYVDECFVQKIDSCDRKQLEELADAVLDTSCFDYQSESDDITWSKVAYSDAVDMYVYGGPTGIHVHVTGDVVETLIAAVISKYLTKPVTLKEDLITGCLLVWALSKVYDINVCYLADCLRAKAVTRKDLCQITNIEFGGSLDPITLELDDTTIYMPPANSVCFYTLGLLMEAAEYLA